MVGLVIAARLSGADHELRRDTRSQSHTSFLPQSQNEKSEQELFINFSVIHTI